jgi:hypothetical protein
MTSKGVREHVHFTGISTRLDLARRGPGTPQRNWTKFLEERQNIPPFSFKVKPHAGENGLDGVGQFRGNCGRVLSPSTRR